jgi:hypothetical protein
LWPGRPVELHGGSGMSNATGIALRIALAAVGAGLAVLVLMADQPGAGPHSLPARAAVSMPASGELAVEPATPDPLLRAGLEPGEEAVGYVSVANQTAVPQRMRFVATGGGRELDGLLSVSLRAGSSGPLLYDGSLETLRSGGGSLLLSVGEANRLEVTVALDENAGPYQGRAANFELVPDVLGGGSP